MATDSDKDAVNAIDALTDSVGGSRGDVVNRPIQQYLDANAWQVKRIKEGLADARARRVFPADEVFAEIAARYSQLG